MQITKGVKFPLQIFGGSEHILLKRCYRTKFIWYAKLAPIRRKFFIKCSYANSHPANPYQTYQSHHANDNQTRKLSLNMMIYTLEHGSVNMTSQYLVAITIIPGNSPEFIPQPNSPYDGMDTDYDMQPDVDASVEQLDSTPTNPRSSEYDLRQNPKPSCNDDYRY